MHNTNYYVVSHFRAIFYEQGTHKSLQTSQNAKATVTAIIDGTGSLGAAVGPLIVGWITNDWVRNIIIQYNYYTYILVLRGSKLKVVSLIGCYFAIRAL